ncbi:MAG: cupin domain-containing protein [Omnitrophica bacterium RIFCSPHIGHO2_02_FULL_46_11]|nr:MAG: cupin domain-containing protein [Omnitrophica bacterium RIFCSPLOWO2_01_FULL_45_10b]OGW86014.1 MAG: cupin domain-containing protein [Omnitrophica bacterium RIFCSPHIGHO2_02_FULL_46_11]
MKTRSEISGAWETRGFSCDLWTDPPAQKWENYRHEVDELIYILEGILELEVSGKKKTLKQGDEAFIPAKANHSVRNVGGTEAKWLYGYKNR